MTRHVTCHLTRLTRHVNFTAQVMVVNGLANMPPSWDNPAVFDPDAAANAASPGTIHWHPLVDSLTLTLSYNTTLSSLGCAASLAPQIMV